MNKYINNYAVIVNPETNEGILVSNCYIFTDWIINEFDDEESARNFINDNNISLIDNTRSHNGPINYSFN